MRPTNPDRPSSDERRVRRRFHSALYTLKGLRAAARNFRGLAAIEISGGKPYHTVVIAPAEGRDRVENDLVDEFSNHALAYTLELKGQ